MPTLSTPALDIPDEPFRGNAEVLPQFSILLAKMKREVSERFQGGGGKNHNSLQCIDAIVGGICVTKRIIVQ